MNNGPPWGIALVGSGLGSGWVAGNRFITGSVPEIEEDGYFVANASIELGINDRWSVTAGVINLFDEEYLIQGNASLATLGYAERIFARPQNWYVQLSAEF
jgi:iron complex outermembrane receptor protein